VSEYCEFYGIVGQRAVQVGSSFLTGKAKQFWRKHKENVDSGRIVDETTQKLNAFLSLVGERFYPTSHELETRDQLEALNQSGSARNFVDRFDELVSMLPSNSYSERDMIDRFIRKLKKHTQLQVRMKAPATLMQAYAFAKETDSIYYQVNRLQGQERRPVPRRDPNAMEVDQINLKSNGRPYRGQKQQDHGRQSRPPQKEVRCFRCDAIGHIARYCKNGPARENEEEGPGNGKRQE
jgi:hypothetical protein